MADPSPAAVSNDRPQSIIWGLTFTEDQYIEMANQRGDFIDWDEPEGRMFVRVCESYRSPFRVNSTLETFTYDVVLRLNSNADPDVFGIIGIAVVIEGEFPPSEQAERIAEWRTLNENDEWQEYYRDALMEKVAELCFPHYPFDDSTQTDEDEDNTHASGSSESSIESIDAGVCEEFVFFDNMPLCPEYEISDSPEEEIY